MAISLLRELPELKVVVVHPPDEEGMPWSAICAGSGAWSVSSGRCR